MAAEYRPGVRRLLRLWGLYAAMDLLFIARGPQAATFYYLADLVIGTAAVTATFLLAERFDGIGLWSRPQVLFLLGYALLVRGLIALFFNYNVYWMTAPLQGTPRPGRQPCVQP